MDPFTLIAMLAGPILGMAGTAMGSSGGSTAGKYPPPKPKAEFQPMQRTASRFGQQPMNFDPGATSGGIDPNNLRLQAIDSLRGKLGL